DLEELRVVAQGAERGIAARVVREERRRGEGLAELAKRRAPLASDRVQAREEHVRLARSGARFVRRAQRVGRLLLAAQLQERNGASHVRERERGRERDRVIEPPERGVVRALPERGLRRAQAGFERL